MKNREIVFTKPNTVEMVEEEIPKPGENEILVRLMVSTISSGTERTNLIGEVNVGINQDVVIGFPRRGGYSSSGIVEKVGSEVKKFQVGDRVALTESTHSMYVLVSEKNVHKIKSENICFEEAALWHIATFPAATIRKCRLELGESAIVMGVGVLGMIAIKLLKVAGAVPIIAVDPSCEKRKLALQIGADYAFRPEDCAQKVKEVTQGGANVAIEVTGYGEALEEVLDCMKKFGRVALLGCTRNSDFTIDYYHKVHGPGISLIGAHTAARPEYESSPGMWTTHDDVSAVQRLVQFGRLNLADLVEETHSPEEAPLVYQRLIEEKSFPLVQFDWRRMK